MVARSVVSVVPHRSTAGRRNPPSPLSLSLAALTGISQETLRSVGSRLNYRPTLGNVEKLCRALDVPLHDLLELIDDPPKPSE